LRDSLWRLDFSDLGAKGVGYARHQSLLKEVSDAYPTAHDGTGVGPLPAMGSDQHKRLHRYHRVLSHASWSSVKASRVLLGLLVEMFVPEGDPLIEGIDETLERRYGKKISVRASTATLGALYP
jgi:DDE superfamily endonuclease